MYIYIFKKTQAGDLTTSAINLIRVYIYIYTYIICVCIYVYNNASRRFDGLSDKSLSTIMSPGALWGKPTTRRGAKEDRGGDREVGVVGGEEGGDDDESLVDDETL